MDLFRYMFYMIFSMVYVIVIYVVLKLMIWYVYNIDNLCSNYLILSFYILGYIELEKYMEIDLFIFKYKCFKIKLN